MLFEELIEAFLYSRRNGIEGAKVKATPITIKNYAHALKGFVSFMQSKRKRAKFTSVTRLDMRAFIESLNSNERWTEATRIHHLRSLRALLRWIGKSPDCKDAGIVENWLELLPVIPATPSRTFIPTKMDLKNWRSAFNVESLFGYRDYVVFCLVMTTGMRIGEVCFLQIPHLQLTERQIYVPTEGKTDSRLVPITHEMVALLKGWLRRRPESKQAETSPYVFISKYDPKCTPNGFDQRFRKLRNKYHLPAVTPHTVRHAFCTYYLRNGGNMERLRNITGHSTYEMLKNYLKLAEVGKDSAKDELEECSPLKMLSKK